MKRTLFFTLPFFCLIAVSGVGAQEWFRSDPFGQPLSPVTASDVSSLEWALRVDRDGPRDISRLYHNGTERKRWERTRAGDLLVEEVFFDRGIPREHLYFDPHGRMIEEWIFTPDGQLEEKHRYTYPEDPGQTRWLSREIFTAGDEPVSTDRFSYRPDGSLKSIRRVTGSGTDFYQLYRYGRAGTVREIGSTRKKIFKSSRYDDAGRLAVEEVLNEGEVLSRTEYYRREDGSLENRREENFETRVLVITEFAPGDLAVRESRYHNGFLSEVIRREFDTAGRLVTETITGAGSSRERRLTWADGKEEPVTEEIFSGGALVRRLVRPEPGQLVEERFHGGDLILKTWYREGVREKEEHYRDGELIQQAAEEVPGG